MLDQHEDVAGGGTHMFDLKGYPFDSGLHYTVPWSRPLLALTTGKKTQECTQFELMGEKDGTVDKIYLVNPDGTAADKKLHPFCMRHGETHWDQLLEIFPDEKECLKHFTILSDRSMVFVKVYCLIRLFPKYLQEWIWYWFVPRSITDPVNITAKELLPTITNNTLLKSLLSSMWIDTGARPDRASFMMTASVFRGISMEGGCYPLGSSEAMGIELAEVIHRYKGKLLIRAAVKEVEIKNNRVTGVVMSDTEKTLIKAKKGVISSIGYVNTFSKLVDKEVCATNGVPRQILCQSAGFVMCNIGISLSSEEIGATNTNTWHIPVNDQGDAFGPLNDYFENPLKTQDQLPAFITFPSIKDQNFNKKFPNKVSCQMLLMAEYDWFDQFKGDTTMHRKEGYEELKEEWKKRCLKIFLKYFPKAQGHIEVCDISTPLSIEHYLGAHRGGAVGLDVIPERFISPQARQNLDVVTNIKGLYLTGQDTGIIGVTLAQLSGVTTAFRLSGFLSSSWILFQSIFG